MRVNERDFKKIKKETQSGTLLFSITKLPDGRMTALLEAHDLEDIPEMVMQLELWKQDLIRRYFEVGDKTLFDELGIEPKN